MTPLLGWRQVRANLRERTKASVPGTVLADVKRLQEEVRRLRMKQKIVEEKFDQANRHD